MPGGVTVPVAIDLLIGSEPIAGSLRVSSGPPRAFSGWLQLTSLLQAAVEHLPETVEAGTSVEQGA